MFYLLFTLLLIIKDIVYIFLYNTTNNLKLNLTTAAAQNLFVRVDELLVILDQAKQLLGIVNGTHRLLQYELMTLASATHLLVQKHGLQALGTLRQLAGLAAAHALLPLVQPALDRGLMPCSILVVAADVADDCRVHVVDALGGIDDRLAYGRCAGHLTLHVLTDQLLEYNLPGHRQVAASYVPPADLRAHRLEVEHLCAPHLATHAARRLALAPRLAEQLPLDTLEAGISPTQALRLQAHVHLMPQLLLSADQRVGRPVQLVHQPIDDVQLADALVKEAALGRALIVGMIADYVMIPLIDHTIPTLALQHPRTLIHNQLLIRVVNGRIEDEQLILTTHRSAKHHQLCRRLAVHGQQELRSECCGSPIVKHLIYSAGRIDLANG